MSMKFTVLFIMFLAAHLIRFVYEVLKKAGKVNIENKPLFIFIFSVMCLLWLSWFTMCPLDPLDLAVPNPIRFFGLGIFIAGLFLAFGALFQLRGVENIDHLVTTGLFSRLRHPMYLGFIFWIFGWAVYNGAGLSLIAGLIGIGNIIYWRYLEDHDLSGKYGDAYFSYRDRTWF